MDRLHAIQVFVRAVEAGSLSAAARDLKLGQPAVSKTVAALERDLGTRLLLRTTRKISPTEAGLAFYERARRALDEAEEAWLIARQSGSGFDGRLRVCAPVTFARLHVAPHLGEFLSAHPKLSLELVMDDRNVDLLEAGIDVGLRMGTLADSTLSARKLATGTRFVVASRRYLQEHGEPREPADLHSHSAIIYSQNARGEQWNFRRGTSEVSIRVRSRLAFSAAEGVREAVIAGLGVAIASEWMMTPELVDGSVVPVLREWTLRGIDLWAVYPAGRMPSAKARAFVSWFADRIRSSPHAGSRKKAPSRSGR